MFGLQRNYKQFVTIGDDVISIITSSVVGHSDLWIQAHTRIEYAERMLYKQLVALGIRPQGSSHLATMEQVVPDPPHH